MPMKITLGIRAFKGLSLINFRNNSLFLVKVTTLTNYEYIINKFIIQTLTIAEMGPKKMIILGFVSQIYEVLSPHKASNFFQELPQLLLSLSLVHTKHTPTKTTRVCLCKSRICISKILQLQKLLENLLSKAPKLSFCNRFHLLIWSAR